MKKLCRILREMVAFTNFDGLRCTVKGDPGFREIMGALKRQQEIDRGRKEA